MKQQQISPEKYIVTRARSLPLAECYVNSRWNDCGMAQVIVCRKHVTGNITAGFYLIDTFALGVKDCLYKFNLSTKDFGEILDSIRDKYVEINEEEFIETTYTIAHNIIYGGIAFAEEYGYKPCREFQITRHILEEDTDEIELIEFEFGKDGKPFLML